MDLKPERLKKMSSVISMVILVATVVLVIMMVLTVSAGIMAMVNDEIMDELMRVWPSDNEVWIGLLMSILAFFTMLAMLIYARRLFKNVSRSHTPFDEENVTNLNYMGHALLVFAIGLPALNYVLIWAFSPDAPAMEGFGNLVLIVVAIVFYCMSLIFRHGAALQRESDETL